MSGRYGQLPRRGHAGGGRRPPPEALAKLRELGHARIEWVAYRDDWWAGYNGDTKRLITVCLVTGKAIIEILKGELQVEVLTDTIEEKT